MGHAIDEREDSEGSEHFITTQIQRLIHALPQERQLNSVFKVIKNLNLLQSYQNSSPINVHPQELQSKIDNASPFIKLVVNGAELEMTLDSGAHCTIICEKTAKLLRWAITPLNSNDPPRMCGVGGNVSVIGKVSVEVVLRNKRAMHDFFVIESRERYLRKLLGVDLAKKLGLVFNFNTKKIYFCKDIKNESISSNKETKTKGSVQSKKPESLENKEQPKDIPQRKNRTEPWQPWMNLRKGTERTALKHAERKKRAQKVGTAEYRRRMDRIEKFGLPNVFTVQPVRRHRMSRPVTADDIFINNYLVVFQSRHRGCRVQYHGLYAKGEAMPQPWLKAKMGDDMIHILAIRFNDYVELNVVKMITRERLVYSIPCSKEPFKFYSSDHRIVAAILQNEDIEEFQTTYRVTALQVGEGYAKKLLERVVSDIIGHDVRCFRGQVNPEWIDAKEWPN